MAMARAVALLCVLACAMRPCKATPLASLHHHHAQHQQLEEEFRFQDMPGTIQAAVLEYCCGDKTTEEARTACHLQVSVATTNGFQRMSALSFGLIGRGAGETGERLGQGAFGKVDSVRCNRPDRPELALKKVCDQDCHTSRSRGEFAVQKRATERCCAEGQPCPRVYAYKLAKSLVPCCMGTYGHHWVLMSKLEGTDMGDAPRSVSLPNMLHQIVDQLKCLHSNGIVHNDVKPQNIQVSADGKQFGLLDYGLSCMDKTNCPTLAAGTPHMLKVNYYRRTSTNTQGGDYFALAHTYHALAHREFASESEYVSCETETKAIARVCAALAFDGEARRGCRECSLRAGAPLE